MTQALWDATCFHLEGPIELYGGLDPIFVPKKGIQGKEEGGGQKENFVM